MNEISQSKSRYVAEIHRLAPFSKRPVTPQVAVATVLVAECPPVTGVMDDVMADVTADVMATSCRVHIRDNRLIS